MQPQSPGASQTHWAFSPHVAPMSGFGSHVVEQMYVLRSGRKTATQIVALNLGFIGSVQSSNLVQYLPTPIEFPLSPGSPQHEAGAMLRSPAF